MNKDSLVEDLMRAFILLKRSQANSFIKIDKFGHSQKVVLFIIHKYTKNNQVSLCDIKKEIKLAPSTVTAIINSLEENELIVRKIDKTDRRNIFLQITPKGVEYTNKAYIQIKEKIGEYIDYMGEEDIETLMKLILKTSSFFEERKN